MDHSPTHDEQQAIDALLERFSFEFVPIRLTATMLTKSIIDAGLPVRSLLARQGEVDYTAMEQGRARGMELNLPVAGPRGLEHRTVSFYRPETKSGDPRLWVSRLGDSSSAGELLLACRSENGLFFVCLGSDIQQLVAALARLMPPREDDLSKVGPVLAQFQRELDRIRALGWVPTMRKGDTGIGFTFESLLGIRANSARKPDYFGIELKCHRGGRGSGSKVSLFAKTPSWGAIRKGRGLLELAGKVYEDTGRLRLYCTLNTAPNSFELALLPTEQGRRIELMHRGIPTVYYPFASLEKSLRSKHKNSIFVTAETRGNGATEEFRFTTARFCSDPSFGTFLQAILDDAVTLDLTLSVLASGRTRDHGYLWRTPQSHVPKLFAYQRELA
jgi:hypothetical protein